MRPNKKLWGKNSYGACAEQLSGRHSNSWQLERGDLNDDYYMHLVEISERPRLSIQIRSDQISRLVVSDSLRPHESQHARPSCPSPTPGVHSDSLIESVMPSSHLILCRPLLLLAPIPPSIRVFSNEPTLCMRRPN